MAKDIKQRPFALLGHRTIKSLLNEEAFSDDQPLELVVAPALPKVSGEHEGKKVIVFSMTIMIARAGTTKKPTGSPPLFSLEDTALGVTVEAGYSAREDAHDGDMKAFAAMFPYAVATAFQATRAAAQVLALESGFDASYIPQEVDESEFFKQAGSGEAKNT